MTTENTFENGQEVWVKSSAVDVGDNDYCVVVDTKYGQHCTYVTKDNIRTTEQIIAENAEPDFTTKLQVGAKVQLVERWGRKPYNLEDKEQDGFVLNGTYIVEEPEDSNHDVLITSGDGCYYVPFYFLNFVAPPKYWLHESPKTYSIYYKGQFGRVITAMLMQKDLYTLEEAQEQCDNLNKRFQDND